MHLTESQCSPASQSWSADEELDHCNHSADRIRAAGRGHPEDAEAQTRVEAPDREP